MGRFETSAEFYRFREPYSARLFEEVTRRLGLSRETRMLDVGCGPANLAIGFAPYVGSCTAIDIEPEMLRVARMEAAKAGAAIEFVQTRVEDLDAPDGAFDFVTIGRAIHWLAREATLAVFERVVTSGGYVAVCSATSSCEWTERFREIRQKWSGDRDEAKYRPDLDEWFAPSRFRRREEIVTAERYRWTLDELVGRGLSFSVTSPAELGEKRAEFEQELRAALTPFAVEGVVDEEVSAKATIFG